MTLNRRPSAKLVLAQAPDYNALTITERRLMPVRLILSVLAACLTFAAATSQTTPQNDKERLLTPEQFKEFQKQRLEAMRLLDNEWYRGNRISVRESLGQRDLDVSFEIFDQASVLINRSSQSEGKKEQGELLVVDGQWLLAKDLAMPRGYEIDYLDEAILAVRLSLRLLSKVAPDGPAKILKARTFNIQEKKRLAVATQSAEIDIDPPWSLEATIEPLAPDKCSFSLNLKAAHDVRLRGTWQKDAIQPVLGGDTPLSGWQVYTLGEIRVPENGHMRVDYGATPSDLRPTTVAELRQAVKK